MSDIRKNCPIICIAKDEPKFCCESKLCLKYASYNQGRAEAVAELFQSLAENNYKVIEVGGKKYSLEVKEC